VASTREVVACATVGQPRSLAGDEERGCGAPEQPVAFGSIGGHKLVVTSDKDGPNSVLERELEIVISQLFWPAYLTAERIAQAPNLKLTITAGIGSDHVDPHHRGQGHLLQLDQRRRARGDDGDLVLAPARAASVAVAKRHEALLSVGFWTYSTKKLHIRFLIFKRCVGLPEIASELFRYTAGVSLSRTSHSLELDLTSAFSQRCFSHASYTIIVGISDDGVAASSQNLTPSRNSTGCAIVGCGRVKC
jgi:hypothetical protein